MRFIIGFVVLLAAASAVAGEVELTGQVVCSACWSEADRATTPYGTEADLACAARCAAKGVPPALAVRTADGFELLELEGKREWLPLVGRFVRVAGDRHDHDGVPALVATELVELDHDPWSGEHAEATALGWTDLAGHRLSLADLRGRIVVLNFWATWCEPCREEMPDLVEIQDEFGLYGVQVLGAAADPVDAADAVARFARRLDVNFPVLVGATTEQMQSLGAGVALPATVVLDRHGHVAERIRGVVTRRQLRGILERLVHGTGDHAHAPAGKDEGTLTADAGHAHRHGSGTQASLVPS